MEDKATHPKQKIVRVGVVQAGTVLLDTPATLKKCIRLIEDAKRDHPQLDLLLFPEAFIGGYPRGVDFGIAVGGRSPEGRKLFAEYYHNAIEVPGPEVEALSAAAKKADVSLAVGAMERQGNTLYCAILFFDNHGTLIGKHHKIKPTGAERYLWGEGSGDSLKVYNTERCGKIGGLICWENYMPDARMALYAGGVEIYLAPNADSRDSWQATIRHIACEGRCFVLNCNQHYTKKDYPEKLQDKLISDPLCRGGSAIVSPLGEYIAGPLYDEEGILYAELDMDVVVGSKWDFDVLGHYYRPDLFKK